MDQHHSVTELYSQLCIRFRIMKRAEADKTRICRHCSMFEIEHDQSTGELRCMSYIGGWTFAAVTEDEQAKVEKSLPLLEQLAEVNGWKL